MDGTHRSPAIGRAKKRTESLAYADVLLKRSFRGPEHFSLIIGSAGIAAHVSLRCCSISGPIRQMQYRIQLALTERIEGRIRRERELGGHVLVHQPIKRRPILPYEKRQGGRGHGVFRRERRKRQ